MTPFLVILLAIALAFVVAGFLLSSKPQAYSSRTRSGAVRTRPRVVVESVPMRIPGMVEPQPIRSRRLVIAAQRRASVPISTMTMSGHIYGRRRTDQPFPWSLIIVGLLAIFILGLYSMKILLPHPALWSLVTFIESAPVATPPPSNQTAPRYSATQNLVRLSQLDAGQYNSPQEYKLWAYSACSAAAMTEVINAYGHHYRVTDILKVEAQIGEITPQLGLLEEVGIQRTVAQFGFNTTWGHNLSLDQIIDIANHGRPVIVGFPPNRYDGGHLLVVTGGNSSTVNLADSSLWNRRSLSRAQFLQWWEGFSAIVTPK